MTPEVEKMLSERAKSWIHYHLPIELRVPLVDKSLARELSYVFKLGAESRDAEWDRLFLQMRDRAESAEQRIRELEAEVERLKHGTCTPCSLSIPARERIGCNHVCIEDVYRAERDQARKDRDKKDHEFAAEKAERQAAEARAERLEKALRALIEDHPALMEHWSHTGPPEVVAACPRCLVDAALAPDKPEQESAE